MSNKVLDSDRDHIYMNIGENRYRIDVLPMYSGDKTVDKFSTEELRAELNHHTKVISKIKFKLGPLRHKAMCLALDLDEVKKQIAELEAQLEKQT